MHHRVERMARGLATALVVSTLSGGLVPASAQMLPKAAPESVGMSSARLERLDATLQRYIDDHMLAGVVSLVARDGKVVHLSALGSRYIEGDQPMTTDDIFVIMSMTKPIVSTALMMLYEEGYFLLDDPISKYAPQFADKEVVVEGQGGPVHVPARPLTFRHILTHTSGVDPDRDLLTDAERAMAGRKATLAETMAARGPLPLAFQPGDEWRYGSSTDYVAYMVEQISGQRIDEFLQERIFGPLGMHDSFFFPDQARRPRLAVCYKFQDGGLHRQPGGVSDLPSAPKYPAPEGGLYSTAQDMAAFHQMVLDDGVWHGRRILSRASAEVMTEVHTGDLETKDAGFGWGIGWHVVRDARGTLGLLSPGTFGHGGAWGTYGFADRSKDLVAVLMMQHEGRNEQHIRQVFTAMVNAAIDH